MSDFMNALKNTLVKSDSNLIRTENGALGYKTTGKALLDLNFAVSSMRNWPDKDIVAKFADACAENLDNAVVWLFFARDARQGMGERRLFRVCVRYLADNFPEVCDKVLSLVAEYGRWDDIFEVFDTKVHEKAVEIVCGQLVADLKAAQKGESVSLLAKWLPSINSHNWKTREKATKIARYIGLNRFDYQKLCSKLRKHINLVESKMSAGKWDEIDYEAVPSKANLVYNTAFFRHDEDRRREFLSRVKDGEAKINASVVFPYEIVSKYEYGWFGRDIQPDDTLEAMWKALPNYVTDGASTLVVADGSGSMTCGVGSSGVTALDVANSLAIYFAERLTGAFHNTYITFSSRPQIVQLGDGTLASKLTIAYQHDECSNTNIEATFDLILDTAVDNKMKQEDLPRNILIVSDMEFDSATYSYGRSPANESLFSTISSRFEEKGYQMPRLIFWNVNSRTGAIPLTENPNGIALVSGFSPAVAKMVLSGELDPLNVLLETLHSERYTPVWDALK